MTRKLYILFITLTLCCVTAMAAAPKRFTLVIDAGHGGHDAGAVGAFSKEKDINLRTALAFGRYVEKYCPDVNVIYTRKTDVFVTLHGRAEIANKAKADLFMSIHTNAQPPGYKTARGLETYTLGMHRAGDNLDVAKRENGVILIEKDYKERYQGFNPNSSESYIIFEFMQDNNMQRSVDLAKLVQKNVCSIANRPDKGVKQAGFLVLRETSMPSCLIELGFISTPADEQLLNDEASVDNIARGIYQAFAAYKAKYDGNGTKAKDAQPMVAAKQKTEKTEKTEKSDKTEKPGKPEPRKPEAVTEEVKPKAEQQKPAPASETASKQKKEQPAPAAPKNKPAADPTAPVFKVQVTTATRELKANAPELKGEKDADFYKEGNIYKYTVGASTDYNEIYRLRKSLVEKFPDCFIIAFKNGEKINVNEGIREFKERKGKK